MKKKKIATSIFLKFFVVMCAYALWELWVRLNPNSILPSPTNSIIQLFLMIEEGTLLIDCLNSLQRVLVGFTLASISGVILGVSFGIYPKIYKLFSPIFETLRPIPPIAWIPISIVLFTLGNPSSYFVIFIGAFFPIFSNTLLGVQEVLPLYIEVSKSLGASQWRTFINVVLPSSLPSIFAGLRVGLGFAWMCVIAAEMIAARSGLGYMIQLNRQLLSLDRVVAGMITIGVIGLIMTKLMEFLEIYLIPWRNSKTNTNKTSFINSEILANKSENLLMDKYIGGCQIEINNIYFGYTEEHNVLNNFSLEIPRNQVLCIIGLSGCGKTTLIRLLAGLEKPAQGKILLNKRPLIENINNVTMVFQGFSLFPWKTAYKNVLYAMHDQTHRININDSKNYAHDLLEMVGLSGKSQFYPSQLSGGQQQRVSVIRALAKKPHLLLLDEPLASLDSYTREILQNDISQIINKCGITTIIITHDISEALYMGDRIIVMSSKGEIIKDVLVPFREIRPRPQKLRHEPEMLKIQEELWNLLRENE